MTEAELDARIYENEQIVLPMLEGWVIEDILKLQRKIRTRAGSATFNALYDCRERLEKILAEVEPDGNIIKFPVRRKCTA
jgi:hypothetical protein